MDLGDWMTLSAELRPGSLHWLHAFALIVHEA